jgi:16S rRNA processing protein RimM
MARKGRARSTSPRRAAGAARQRGGGRAPLVGGEASPQPCGERVFTIAPDLNLVLLGEFGRAHGLNGEVRIKSFTAEPAAIAGYGALVDGRGRPVVLEAVRPAGGDAADMLIARVAGVTTREAAESLNGSPLFIPRERLPAPDDADDFFLADLIGLAVEDTAGRPLGTVMAVPNYGAGDLLEITPRDGGPSALLPFTQAFVPVVDVPGKRIVLDPPADLFAPAADASGPEQP